MSSRFFTNEQSNLFDKFKGITANMRDLYAFHAVVAYFRSSGYFKLQPYLKSIQSIKILVGINVDKMFAEAHRKGLLFLGDEKRTRDEFLDWLVQDIREAGYLQQVENGIRDFIEDLIDGRIEVRAHAAKTVHAKFYLLLPEQHSEHSDGWVIMGSSNLTAAGLGIQQPPNYELNIALKNYADVAFTKCEFEKLWQDATPILAADMHALKKQTHIGQHFSPYEIYLKLLIEYFDKNIDYDPSTVGDLPASFKTLSYQIDAVNEGFQMLIRHNGFFLADVVGLGKTVMACMIAKRFLIANGSQNTKILVIYPPALEQNWKDTFHKFRIDKHCKFISNGSLHKVLDGNVNYWPKEDYDLILVDEAHKFRNRSSQSFEKLQKICKAPRDNIGLIPGTNKKVILISATPLNNRPQDLHNQLLLFQDDRRSTLPVTNLQAFFAPIEFQYRDIIKANTQDTDKVRELYERIREKVIAPVTVRRTRQDLKNHPKYLEDLQAQGFRFPEIAPLQPINYDLDADLNQLFQQTISYLTDKDKINYYRYQAIAYLQEGIRSEHYKQALNTSRSLAGIMKTLMIKRLESSFDAFTITLNNLLKATRTMLAMFANDRILIAPDLNIAEEMKKGFDLEKITAMVEELSIENPGNKIFAAADFAAEFLPGLKQDAALLQDLADRWQQVAADPKFDKLMAALDTQLFEPTRNPGGKLIIFTESNDTANYLAKKLQACQARGVLKISAANRQRQFASIQKNFDANYAQAQQADDYHILITTDVLAEGVNLHRANVLVNYDAPWNATRLMQRIGRINRIGGTAEHIYPYHFYPSEQGDAQLKLYHRVLIKLQAFHNAFGEDVKVFTREELLQEFELFRKGIKGEEDSNLKYLRVIREFKDQHPEKFKRIEQLPLKARTARGNAFAKRAATENASLIFLKSSYKSEFYQVTAANEVTPLSFLQAAHLFAAKADEPGLAIPPVHYAHVNTALRKFAAELLADTQQHVTGTADPLAARAMKFLRDMKPTHNTELKKALDQLIDLIDKGVYTPLPNKIKKLKKQTEQNQLSRQQAEESIMAIAKEYPAPASAANNDHELMDNDPAIVITETFRP